MAGANQAYGANVMIGQIPTVTRERADLYAARAMMAELVRYLARGDSRILNELREAGQSHILKPMAEDTVVSELSVRESYEAILQKAES